MAAVATATAGTTLLARGSERRTMGPHGATVFRNSCLKLPVDPANRLPSAMYERPARPARKPVKAAEFDIPELHRAERDPLSFREFYRSIPDYRDVTHLSNREFYLKLESLREDKRQLLRQCGNGRSHGDSSGASARPEAASAVAKQRKSDFNNSLRDKEQHLASVSFCESPEKYLEYGHDDGIISDGESILCMENTHKDCVKISQNSNIFAGNIESGYFCHSPKRQADCNKTRSKRTSSACSISWHGELGGPPEHGDSAGPRRGASVSPASPREQGDPREARSAPASPAKRDRDAGLPRSGGGESAGSCGQFRARPVPIESRIPLYDKILEDQELRRSITRLQSAAELQAQMRPFSFTERAERGRCPSGRCLGGSSPQLAAPAEPRGRRFRAKPVPKNLFSNYVYEKMREDDYYRALNRRIRAEEMLRAAALPPAMARREKRQQDCCSDDSRAGGRNAARSARRLAREDLLRQELIDGEFEDLKRDFVLTGGKSADSRPKKSGRKLQNDFLQKVYGAAGSDATSSPGSQRAQSATVAALGSVNRSNLAAVLRIEASKRKLEGDVLKRLEEERFQSETRWRDSVLRKRPAWTTLKYSHSGDLALRLQTRRDEERLRRERFLHEMELMYGRVHRQPLLFERTYSPRRRPARAAPAPRSALSRRAGTPGSPAPARRRKVSINETAETIGGEFDDGLDKDSNGDGDKDSVSSEDIPESIEADHHSEKE